MTLIPPRSPDARLRRYAALAIATVLHRMLDRDSRRVAGRWGAGRRCVQREATRW